MKAFSSMTSGPDVICYVIEIGSYTEEELGVYKRLKALLDGDVVSYMLLVFTHGDRLGGKGVGEVLQRAPTSPLLQVLAECGDRHWVVDNTLKKPGSQEQVKGLLEAVRKMKTANGGRSYQCPHYVTNTPSLAGELTARMDSVDRCEALGKKFTQRLTSKLDQTQVTATTQRHDLAKKTQERDAKLRAKETSLQQQVNDASARLSQQQQSVAAQTSQVQKLQAKQAQDAQQRQQQQQQLQAQHAAALQQKANEIATLK
ncbi:hypothetical protein V1264_004933 [Littorina saxatilis]|uniref:AIG1-type G domain-containing protein n=2 Tax=Littorina saxatilis TaxID=31220 RepID=A0AAN9G759_9CAEN